MIEALRKDAADLLAQGKVKLVIGYRAAGNGRRVPALFTAADQANELVFDADCPANLATYLAKPEVARLMPLAIVASPAVVKSLLVLAAESQLKAEQVVVLAVDEQQYVGPVDLKQAAAAMKDKLRQLAADPAIKAKIAELAAMSPAERAGFWAEQFARCTRCYACRANCPACYCKRCIVEKNQPQWVSTAAREHGNYAWQIIRAFHTAGRCVACGACEAACPQDIPLMLLNVYLVGEVESQFGYRAGEDPAAAPLIGSFKPDDKEEFIR